MQEYPKLLTRAQAAAYLNENYQFGAVRTLAKLASTGGGPVYEKYGSLVRYTIADLDAWMTSRRTRKRAASLPGETVESFVGEIA
jgi:hypothetical protein